jgi:penicillin-binding protein 1A
MMETLERILSTFAAVLFRNQWRDLRANLLTLHELYVESLASRIPPILIQALVAAEDRRFYTHGAIDPVAIIRAISRFLTQRRIEGASTIEQQFVRTVTARYEKTLRRKLREILLATLVKTVIPKEDLPGVYLSVAYFGWRMNGIKQACNRLNVSLEQMTLEQATSIVARLKYPEPRVASTTRTEQIVTRSRYILCLVKRANLATKETLHEELVDGTFPVVY